MKDYAQILGSLVRSAEALELSDADVVTLARRHPERYADLAIARLGAGWAERWPEFERETPPCATGHART